MKYKNDYYNGKWNYYFIFFSSITQKSTETTPYPENGATDVATYLRNDEIFNYMLTNNSLLSPVTERILEVDHHLAK